jgi:hypothetical protein
MMQPLGKAGFAGYLCTARVLQQCGAERPAELAMLILLEVFGWRWLPSSWTIDQKHPTSWQDRQGRVIEA